MTVARIGITLRLLLAGVFLLSALSKLPEAGVFEIAIVEQGLAATRSQAAYPARLVIAFELFLGAALLFPYYLKRAILPLVIAMLVAFTALQAYQLTLGEQTPDCGCFGALLPMSSAQSLVKNILLLAMSLWLFKITPAERRRPAVPALLAVGSLFAVLLLAPVRRNDEAKFAQYTQFAHGGRVDLTSGERFVAVFSADCDHCRETARSLGELAAQHANFPQLHALIFAESPAAVSAFLQETHSNYPYHLISEQELVALIGDSAPRIYWLRDGKIAAYWDDDFGRHLLAATQTRHSGGRGGSAN